MNGLLSFALGALSPAPWATAPGSDWIPGQVPEPRLVRVEPEAGRQLRGDYEIPTDVVVVFSDSWPRATRRLAEAILASGTTVSLVRESGSSARGYGALGAQLEQAYPGALTVHDELVETPWVRDWGPVQLRVTTGSLWLDAAHGSAGRSLDDAAPSWLAAPRGQAVARLAWAVEGGAYISNGAGLCVLTHEYLELQRRARSTTPADFEGELESLLATLGCRVTALVPTLIDEQTKHADMIAQFVSPTRLMLAALVEDEGPSEDALRLRAVERGILRAAAALDLDLDLEIIAVPTPPSRPGQNPRSYVNGLRLGDRYLMPSYPELGRRWQAPARAAVERALGSVAVVPVDASELIGAGGAIHCAALGLI